MRNLLLIYQRLRILAEPYIAKARPYLTKAMTLLATHMDELSDTSHRTEFLPASLAIVDQPPSPISRLITRTIMVFFTIALLWACMGTVDIIAVATGKMVPTGRTKVIQPLESGLVHNIHVQDGQKVKAGDVLVEIDTTISQSEQERLRSEAMQEALEVARLKAASSPDLANAETQYLPPAGASDVQIALQKSLLENQLNEIRSKLSGLDKQINEHQSNRDAVTSTIQKLQDSIPYLEQRTDARESLAKKGYGSKIEALTTRQDLIEHQGELEVQKHKLAEAEAAIAGLQQQKEQAIAEYHRNILKDLAEAEEKYTSSQEHLVQATEKYRQQTLTSPVDGTVQQLAIHTQGGVVTPAQVLMSIVPADSHLEIEAKIPNRDIGFVKAGQEAHIKVDAFNFTEYGLLHGKVISISQDAVPHDKPVGNEDKKSGDMSESSEPLGQELSYSIRVAPDSNQMQIDDRIVPLTAGMAVTVEIKTGSRHIIQYLLSPIKKHLHNAFREQ